MEPECIPFSSIPHTTRLFEDFLNRFDRVQRFYARPPLSEGNWWKEEEKKIVYPGDRRQAVTSILERQNRGFGSSEQTLRNISRLREGASAVVTGQQVGLFGGPLFCLLKIVTLAKLAQETGSVPVFWLASEDHDLAEIDFINLPAADGLQRLEVSVAHQENAPVGAVVFGDEISEAINQLEALLGTSEISGLLRESYRRGESFAGAFARFYAKLLPDLGIVLLDPLDAQLHQVASPMYRAALQQSEEINQALLQRSQELESGGYHPQVKVTPSHTLCFYVLNGARTPVRQEGQAFLIGDRKLSLDELLAEVDRCPERFSANVLLRPAIQDYLLPTLCYIGGPAEIAYFAQAEAVYTRLAPRVTPIIPRISATLVESRQAKLLERYGVGLEDIFVGPEKLREAIASRVLPENVMKSFDLARDRLGEDMAAVKQALEKLDRSLVDAAENATSKMRYQLQSLHDKAARAKARRSTELQHHADELSAMLYPGKELQERAIGTTYFLVKHGPGLVQELKQKLRFDCPDHQVLVLGTPG